MDVLSVLVLVLLMVPGVLGFIAIIRWARDNWRKTDTYKLRHPPEDWPKPK